MTDAGCRKAKHDQPHPHRLPHHRRARSRIPMARAAAAGRADHRHAARRPRLASACGAIFRRSSQAATGAGMFVYSRAGYGALDAGDAAAAARLHAARGARRAAESCSTRSASAAACCSAIPTAPRSRRSMPARIRIIACSGVALIAPHFIVEDISVTSIAADQDGLRDHGPQGKARALAQGCRQRLLRLERRLARSEISRLGYFGISRLYPRAGRDRAGRRRPIRHAAPDRDRAGRVLLSGRCDDHFRRGPFPAS